MRRTRRQTWPQEESGILREPNHFTFHIPLAAVFGFAGLPDSAQKVLDHGLRRAEWLISIVQGVIIVILLSLFLIAPSPTGRVAPFQPVLYALAIMLMSLLGRLSILVFHVPVRRLWTYAGVVIDVVVVIALVWSFHLQYGQPLSLFLKAPTQLYLFVVIAWHGLAMDPLRVALAGVSAILGWIFLTVLAIDGTSGNYITRDFVEYLSSGQVLIGAEVDRSVAVLLFSTILFLGISTARLQMITAALGLTATTELSRFFAAGLAKRIAASGERTEAGSAVRRSGAVLMIDIRNFTQLASEHAPEAVLDVLTEVQSRAVVAISRNGGAIDKFLGDGILATFGCVQQIPSPVAQSFRAAFEFHESMVKWNAERESAGQFPVFTGSAISSGEMLFGAVGFDNRLEFTVIGDPVNRVAKLEKLNKSLGSSLIADGPTFAAARLEGQDCQPVRVLTGYNVPGVAKALDLVILI